MEHFLYFKASVTNSWLLKIFCKCFGLRVNNAKSGFMPINVYDQCLYFLVKTFVCAVGSLPFVNLGLPLGTIRPILHGLTPVQMKWKCGSVLVP
jgi:hypothetical protein